MNEFVYAEEAQDAIDNMAQDQDYNDFLESQWSDDEEDDFGVSEDAYLDTYWESLSEM